MLTLSKLAVKRASYLDVLPYKRIGLERLNVLGGNMKRVQSLTAAVQAGIMVSLLMPAVALAQSGSDPTGQFVSRMSTFETWMVVGLASMTGFVFLGGLAGKLLFQLPTVKYVVGSVIFGIVLGTWAVVRSGFLGAAPGGG